MRKIHNTVDTIAENQEPDVEIVRFQAERALKRLHIFDNQHQQCGDRNSQFIPISFELLDNREFRNRYMNKKRFRTYLWLRRNVIRGRKQNDPCDLFIDYWMQGKLATSITLDKLAKDLNLSRSTVSDHIKQLEQDGVISVETIDASDTADGRHHNVLILGVCHKDGDVWFIDEVFKKPNGGK